MKKRKKVAKIIAIMMTLLLFYNFEGSITAYAHETSTITSLKLENNGENVQHADEQMINVQSVELDTNIISNDVINKNDRQDVQKTYCINETSRYAEDESENTDPNYALLIEDENVVQGTLTEQGEMRWYGFILEQRAKASIMLQLVSNVDADIYLFKLNQDTHELNLVGGSATSGLGVSEYCTEVLDEGIYYFGISAYEGCGRYAIAYYQSTQDIQYEVNDSASLATPVDENTSISSFIDNPFDCDYYCITLDEASAVRYSLSSLSTLGYKIEYAGGTGGNIIKGQLVSLKAGKHYFKVSSPNGTYSRTSSYTIRFENIAPVSTDSTATIFACCEKAGIVFQFNSERTKYYVNGNPIDFSYSYTKSLSNSAGVQNYNINLKKTENFGVCLLQEEGTSISPELQQTIPDVARYHSSTFTGISNKDVLTLSVHDWSNKCYTIHNICSGAYAENYLWADLNMCNVFIDPDTGKIIDIEWYNYFYEVGNHSITYYRPYTMKYYYPYWNGEEPKGGDD